jgi:hypothetical protein
MQGLIIGDNGGQAWHDDRNLPIISGMAVSLPTFKPPGPRFVHVPRTTGEEYGLLVDKHSEVISQLKSKLGFKNDKTVLVWLLEQIQQSADISKAIYQLLEN